MIWNKLKNEFIDIIEWLDSSSDTMVYRFERYQNEIKNGAKLTVRPGQAAVFVNEGKIADVFREGVPLRWSGIPQDAGHRGFGQFTAFHEASPSENRAFRVSTARKIRVLTAPTEIPRTLAISE